MDNQLVWVATHAPGRLIVELCCIFTDWHVPHAGTCQSGSKAIGALNALMWEEITGDTKHNYDVHNKEMMHALEAWQHYIEGYKHRIEI